MELLAELSQENLIQLLHEIKSRKVPDVLVARVCGVCPQVIPRWREGLNLPREFDRTYLTLRGLSAVAQYRDALPAEPSTDYVPWQWWRDYYDQFKSEPDTAPTAEPGRSQAQEPWMQS